MRLKIEAPGEEAGEKGYCFCSTPAAVVIALVVGAISVGIVSFVFVFVVVMAIIVVVGVCQHVSYLGTDQKN